MFTPISGRILKLNKAFTSISYMKAEYMECTLHINETCIKLESYHTTNLLSFLKKKIFFLNVNAEQTNQNIKIPLKQGNKEEEMKYAISKWKAG